MKKDLVAICAAVALVAFFIFYHPDPKDKPSTVIDQTSTATQETETSAQIPTDIITYKNQKYSFSFDYPASWRWTSNLIGDDGIAFTYSGDSFQGWSKQARMHIVGIPSSGKNDNEDDIKFILSSYAQTESITRNVPITPRNLPPTAKIEVIEVDGYDTYANGKLRRVKTLYMFAVNKNKHYRFNLNTEPEDYDRVYPVGVRIIESVTFY